jgi:hypothetical protein
MGEMADDVINGFMCSWCGTCFDGEHGYPVLCFECRKGMKKKEMEKHGLQAATLKEL